MRASRSRNSLGDFVFLDIPLHLCFRHGGGQGRAPESRTVNHLLVLDWTLKLVTSETRYPLT